MTKPSAHRLRRRPGFFHPVSVRTRRDGWTTERQCHFLAQLYLTGSVTAAARVVGMTPKSAYRLRLREGAESFTAAWERVLTHPGTGRAKVPGTDYRKVTTPTLMTRFETGRVRPVVYQGRVTGIARSYDNDTVFRLLRRLDAVTPLDCWEVPDE